MKDLAVIEVLKPSVVKSQIKLVMKILFLILIGVTMFEISRFIYYGSISAYNLLKNEQNTVGDRGFLMFSFIASFGLAFSSFSFFIGMLLVKMKTNFIGKYASY